MDQDAECRDHGDQGHQKERLSPGMIGIGAGAVGIEEGAGPYGGGRDDHAAARLGGRPGQRPAGRQGWRAGPVAAGMSAVSAARSA